ncbi:MAG TPA: hypothetical protein VKH15_18650 [Candidatus Acidoferrum sp.]|nr:hypothetical protein [Candidatus Acidoferrum sp.]
MSIGRDYNISARASKHGDDFREDAQQLAGARVPHGLGQGPSLAACY